MAPVTTEIHELMKSALFNLRRLDKTREVSIAITKLEEALMWFNKSRTLSGELTPTETHV